MRFETCRTVNFIDRQAQRALHRKSEIGLQQRLRQWGESVTEDQLRDYYEDVLQSIGPATAIFTFGPARARYELIEAVANSSLHRGTATDTPGPPGRGPTRPGVSWRPWWDTLQTVS